MSIVLGSLGIDRCYLGKIGTGLLKFVTFGGLGMWRLIDGILMATGAMRDAQGRALLRRGY
ncbi:MAG: TM2 domain-containing protein [Thermaerobacter sp.]|nr:TM2 domain-containing protein [Thermaerobacter sp.]